MLNQGQLTATTASTILLNFNNTRAGFIVKSIVTNTDRVFLTFGVSQTGLVASATGFPLEPGESVFFGTEYPANPTAEWNSAIAALANSGSQDIRFIEF